MKCWDKRPAEIANLLNPAFCTIVLSGAVLGYSTEDKNGLPVQLTNLMLPLILHKSTRNSIPKTVKTTMSAWIVSNPDIFCGFAKRVSNLNPITSESILWGLRFSWLNLSKDLRISSTKTLKEYESLISNQPQTTIDISKKAYMLGRLLARSGSVSTIFNQLGVTV